MKPAGWAQAAFSGTMPEYGVYRHSEDVLSMAFALPAIVATGSYDGTVMIWLIGMTHPHRVLVPASFKKTRDRAKRSASSFVSQASLDRDGVRVGCVGCVWIMMTMMMMMGMAWDVCA